MAKRLLSGGEAIAHSALAAGASVIAGYPTDSLAQLIESALRQVLKKCATGAYAQWTVNNKTTLGICAAASLSGFRSLAAFGQTGFSETVQGIAALNHAELQGGLVVIVADEPASDAFTANLDVRRICELAKIPVIDPETAEQAYTSVPAAFLLSERYSIPVVIHISPDINYSSTFFDIQTHTKSAPRKGNFAKNKDSLDVSDLLNEEGQDYLDYIDISGNNLSDIDVRLKEIAYRFSYKDTFASYNRIYEYEQQHEGKHNSRRFARNDDFADDVEEHELGAPKRVSPLDESNIKIGICVCGSAAPYAIEAIETLRKEAHKSRVSTPYIRLLTLGTPFPIPKRTMRKFLDGLNDILVVEEFSSFAEEELIKQCATSFLGPSVHGRFTDEVNYNYTISFESMILHIAAFIDKCLNVKPEKGMLGDAPEPSLSPVVNFGKHSSPAENSKNLTPKQSRTLTGIARRLASPESIYTYNYEIPDRPPVLCAGCPHRASFYAIDKALARLKIPRRDVIVSGDIGCSLLGNNPPLNFLDTYLGEGFSTSLAQGFSLGMPASASDAKSIAILGDSSFFADAVPGITNAIVNEIDITIIVLDNKTCAESGLQPSPTTYGTTDIASVLQSLGIQNVREANPFEFSNAMDSCVKAIRDKRPSAVVLSSKCARLSRSGKTTFINTNKCTGCMECITQLGCPAISFDKSIVGKKSGGLGQAVIDINQCNGCRLCISVCPSEAIRIMMYKDVAELIRQERHKAGNALKDAEFDSRTDETIESRDIDEPLEEPVEDDDENILDMFDSGPLVMIEDEPEVEDEESSDSSEDASDETASKLPEKQYVQADFGTLFGGKNAEFVIDFGDGNEILEETFETDDLSSSIIEEADKSDEVDELSETDEGDELAEVDESSEIDEIDEADELDALNELDELEDDIDEADKEIDIDESISIEEDASREEDAEEDSDEAVVEQLTFEDDLDDDDESGSDER